MMKLNYDWITHPGVTPENREDYLSWLHAARYVLLYRRKGITGEILDRQVAKARAARLRFAASRNGTN